MNDRYEPVRAALPAIMPAITQVQAKRAAAIIWRKFAIRNKDWSPQAQTMLGIDEADERT